VRCALCTLACAFAMLAGPLAGSPVAEAQPTAQPGPRKAPAGKVSKPGAESKPARERRARRASTRGKRGSPKAVVPTAPATAEASAPAAVGTSPRTAADAEVASAAEIRTEGDTQVKVMEFRGLDIEGQLKTPQMLYFLNRMRAEFGRPRLPHRSFMPELEHSAQERVF
jgi:hypothetical protein